MPIPSNYAEIAKEIMVADSSIERTIFIIERYSKITSDSKPDFYNKLMDALSKDENFNLWLNKKNNPARVITSPVDGQILTINPKAWDKEPYIIIDIFIKSEMPKPSLDASSEELLFNQRLDIYCGIKLEEGQEKYFRTEHGIDMDLYYHADVYNYAVRPDAGNYFVNFQKKESDVVVKGDIIVIVEDYTPLPETQALTKIFEVAETHCKSKLSELNEIQVIPIEGIPKNVKTRKQMIKEKTLKEIWKGSDEEYNRAILFLKKTYDENDLPFINEEENGKFVWNRVRKGFQKYLAGFVGVCMDNKLISNNYTAPELVSICRNTFGLETLDKNNFTNLHIAPEKDIFKEPFLNLFKNKKAETTKTTVFQK